MSVRTLSDSDFLDELTQGARARIDLRSCSAFRRCHLAGSVSIPAAQMGRSLYLLPPRSQPLCLIAAPPAVRSSGTSIAASAAAFLVDRGYRDVAHWSGLMHALPANLLTSGSAPQRLWQPSPLLREVQAFLPREGLALDFACGSGRNAVALALAGRSCLGVDILPDAIAQARRLARLARPEPASARFESADLTNPAVLARLARRGPFAILTCFRYLDRALWPWMRDHLAPGGLLLHETFLEEQARVHGKPRRAALLLKPGELRAAFDGLEILVYREGADRDGNFLASLVARRGV